MDPKFIEHDITEWVMKLAASNPNGWFAASHIATRLDVPVELVQRKLVELTEREGWLVAFVDYECPEHDYTLLRRPYGQPVSEAEVVTCTGDSMGEGHEVHPSTDYAMVIFQPTDTLIQHAKKELGSQRI